MDIVKKWEGLDPSLAQAVHARTEADCTAPEHLHISGFSTVRLQGTISLQTSPSLGSCS